MVRLDLPREVLEVLRAKAEMLSESLSEAMRRKADMEHEIQDMVNKLTGLKSLLQEYDLEVPKSKEKEIPSPGEFPEDITGLSMGQAALAILKSRGKYMTASEILQAMRDAGRVMESPNSRDMITMSLKRLKNQIQIRKMGNTNRYKAK